MMDIVGGLLDGTRANGAFLLRSVFEPPWALHIQDQAPLSIAVVATGSAWVIPGHGDPQHLVPGDVMIARGPDPYTVADQVATPPQVFIHPGQVCTDAAGNSLADVMFLGDRSWGNNPAGSTVLVTGTYEHASAVSERLLRALPPLLVLRRDDWNSDLVGLLCAEVQRESPGQEVFLDRLLDLVVLGVVRSWLETAEAQRPAWYRASSDPIVGPVLTLLHERPQDPWTVAGLASEAGVSRAALARRFTDLLGEPPMAYLTGWRLSLAADLLERSELTIGSIARKVGYGSPFALSAAFSRVRGVSPAGYREQVRAGHPGTGARASSSR
jgi:AraC-like DNA-binding protein